MTQIATHVCKSICIYRISRTVITFFLTFNVISLYIATFTSYKFEMPCIVYYLVKTKSPDDALHSLFEHCHIKLYQPIY